MGRAAQVPERAALHAGGTAPAPWEALDEERDDDEDGYVDDPFGDEYEGARAM